MKVYHGSNTAVVQPRILAPNRALDFGAGFYVTTDREQAENWATIVVEMPALRAYIEAINRNPDEKDFFAEFTLRQLRADRLKDQLVFKTEKALQQLKFIEAV
jgi:hypothetical protein